MPGFEEGKAYCHGAASIVNGIITGRGASFGIGLKTEARVRLTDEPDRFDVRIENDPEENPDLAVHCVRSTLAHFGLVGEYGAEIVTTSDIPISRGLKSSSTSANALVLAVLDALGEDLGDFAIIGLGIDASQKAKVTITGAFDDACASYFGGAVVADNYERMIISRYDRDEDLRVLIHVPDRKIRKHNLDLDRREDSRSTFNKAFDAALHGDYRTAMVLNGLTYGSTMGLDTTVMVKAMESGALCAGISGTGPATVILCTQEKEDDLISVMDEDKIILTAINNMKTVL
jgi:shikimate kinase